MLRQIVVYGIAAGLIVAVPMMGLMMTYAPGGREPSVLFGYLTMLAALTMVFLGIKHHRDKVLGGTIRFTPALLIGLGITAVASMIYVIGWEISLGLSGIDFAHAYAKAMVDAAQARGASPLELQKVSATAASFTKMYMNPLYRMSITFLEIFPLGALISFISAALLRDSRLLPARARAQVSKHET
jgi:hypothetical protein